MRILHICNDYCGSKVHQNLYRELSEKGVSHTVYTYFRDASLVGKNQPNDNSYQVIYRPILKTVHRLLYHQKLRDVARDLDHNVNLNLNDKLNYYLVHATTLFSDGPLALHLHKKYGVPYVVTVRNTDINEFLGFATHTWHKGIDVLRNASKIVFISKAPMEKFCRHIAIKHILNNIKEKFVLLPNGVDTFWLNNVATETPSNNQNIIYVGKFDRNKNVKRLMKAVLELKPQYQELQLHLVGGDGAQCGGVFSYCKQYPETFIYHGKIYDKQILRNLYRQCGVFAMPSIHETFGLVYIEALTQHLAVVYTRNQGIDGLLDERVGEKVNALSTGSIKEAIAKILDNRGAYKACEVIDFTTFDWNRIADRYVELYQECLRQCG